MSRVVHSQKRDSRDTFVSQQSHVNFAISMANQYSRDQISSLVERILNHPKIKKTRNLELLKKLWRQYDELNSNVDLNAGDVNRLKIALKRLISDRSLWTDQISISVSKKHSDGYRLVAEPIHSTLTATQQIWFHLFRRIRSTQQSSEEGRTANSLVFVSEPLFFYSPTLRAYVRFLDINWHSAVDANCATELRSQVISHLITRLPHLLESTVRDVVDEMGFTPNYHYSPTGDAQAAVRIRRFFRTEAGTAPNYEHTHNLSARTRDDFNIILIGNARTTKDIDWFQNTHNPPVLLTDDGITLRGVPHLDEIHVDELSKVWVIFSCWRLSTGNVLFSLASNHTRAIDRVAEALVKKEECADWAARLMKGRTTIPDRFQLVFRVSLVRFESKALDPELEGEPLVAD